MGPQMTDEWINVRKLVDFETGERILIAYANTDNMTWHIGVMINEQ